MIIHNKEGKGGRFTICLISFFQVLNSVLQHVLWNFCDLFTFNAIASAFICCSFPFTCLVIPIFSFEQEEKRVKVVADSHLIMISNTVMRWILSPKRDCTTEGFLGVSWEISGRINRPGSSGDSLVQHGDTWTWRWEHSQVGSLVLTSRFQVVEKFASDLIYKFYNSFIL